MSLVFEYVAKFARRCRAWLVGYVTQVGALDRRSIALFRMGLALLALADVVQRSTDLTAHYSDSGVLPRVPLISQFMRPSLVCLHLLSGLPVIVGLLFALHALLALCLLVGWRSRTMAALLWFSTYSIHVRNPMVLQGGDDLLRLMLFWSLFLPLGARFSIDAALHRSIEVQENRHQLTLSNRYVSISSVALLTQVILVYACTTCFKTGAPWHQEGSAVFYALNYDQLVRPIGIWLRQYDALLPYLTHMTMALETVAPFALLCPFFFSWTRTLSCFALIGMHHLFAACLLLGLFPWIDTVSLLVLLPAGFWQACTRRLDWTRQQDVCVYYDKDCDFCKKMVFVLQQALLLPNIQVRPAQSEAAIEALMMAQHSWVVKRSGQTFTQWSGFVQLLDVSVYPHFITVLAQRPWSLFWGNKAYRFVADRRDKLVPWTSQFWPWAPVCVRPNRLGQMICGLFVALVVWWNLVTLYTWTPSLPAPMHAMMLNLRLDQSWNMFSPYPATDDGWFVIEGILQDKTAWDVWRQQPGEVSFEKPSVVSDMMPNQRWSKYMMNIWASANAQHRLYFGQYLCRRHNGDAPLSAHALMSFKIYYMREDTLPNKTIDTPKKVLLWEHYCWQMPPEMPVSTKKS